MNEQEITNYVLSLIPKEEKDRVFKQEYCAIGTDFYRLYGNILLSIKNHT